MNKDIIKFIAVFVLLILCFKLASEHRISTYDFDKAQNTRYLQDIEKLKESEVKP